VNNLRLNAKTPVLVIGPPSGSALRHIRLMHEYGTNIVAGVTLLEGETGIDGIAFFQSCAEAISATGANVAVTLVPPETTGYSVLEAAEAGVGLIVSPTFLVPIHDTMRTRRRVRDLGAVWIGPGGTGLAIPESSINLGVTASEFLRPGKVGVIAKPSTLSLEVGFAMLRRNLGISMWVGVGVDFMKGTRPADLLPFFAQDQETAALILICGRGGHDDEEFANAIRRIGFDKPVFALLVGENAADADSQFMRFLESRESSSLPEKRTALEQAGVAVYDRIDDLIKAIPTSQPQ
jgi:succinyl-CoA synthetase alpha subunit